MQRNVEEPPVEGGVDTPSSRAVVGGVPPTEPPQSGMSILLNILLFILVPTVLLVLTKLLTE